MISLGQILCGCHSRAQEFEEYCKLRSFVDAAGLSHLQLFGSEFCEKSYAELLKTGDIHRIATLPRIHMMNKAFEKPNLSSCGLNNDSEYDQLGDLRIYKHFLGFASNYHCKQHCALCRNTSRNCCLHCRDCYDGITMLYKLDPSKYQRRTKKPAKISPSVLGLLCSELKGKNIASNHFHSELDIAIYLLDNYVINDREAINEIITIR